MGEESEKRFNAVMDKLFLSPPNSTRVTNSGYSRGRKRSFSTTTATTTLALAEPKSKGTSTEKLQNNASGGTPVCRPWDRKDLLARIATFKSMTWFAKPEVVSAINCARRGWVNVDTDTIACESCRARLFFSTPSSWAQEQVEKAASVFSLKLNSGHKLLCPWVDNACDEKLAQFPPTSPADLVGNYKKRYASLLQLLELPVISSTAIDYMRSPLLEHFLQCPPTLDECGEALPVSYFQAQKLISLCGWEPRLLPYIVDCKDVQNAVSDAQNASITVYSSRASENMESHEGSSTENEQYDHTSVVLECRLCGATVGLWAFRTTPRPPEYVRLIGHAEIDNKHEAACQIDNTNHHSLETSHVDNGEQTAIIPISNTPSSSKNLLNLTIAGGPPPAEQNFCPKISLPVVGQNLRARFTYAFESIDGDHPSSTNNGVIEAIGDENNGQMSMGGDSIMKAVVSESDTTTADLMENVNGKTPNESDNAPESLAIIETADTVARNLATSLHSVSDTSIVVNDYMQTLGLPLNSSSSVLEKDLEQPTAAKAMEFDPIKQHRHFCPWIASSGKPAPGWKQTLAALGRLKEFVYPSEIAQASSSLIEVDDPVGSVKKLLTPPSAKRKKFMHGSS
uniref:uncharacterized protein LOC122586697 n=1 Tax=Erigeron canadensis TaxID=72917 RepID=UPI001CB8D6F9|nr:uncharacterized protein LOC122586697 [Erigeron canadensis]